MIISKLKENIVSNKLGNSKTDEGLGNLVTVTVGIDNAVYEDELYYPTTGIYAPEDISAWYWDRTHAQAYSDLPTNEITDHVGGYKYNIKECIPEDYFQGAVLDGLELKDVVGVAEWRPVLKTGSYSLFGTDKLVYSDASICKRIEGAPINLSEYNKDNITVAMYERDPNYIKRIFREYKEDSYLYNYTIDDAGDLSAQENEFVVADKNLVAEYTAESFELLGIKSNKKQSFYTKYFPLKSDSVKVRHVDGDSFSDVEEIEKNIDYDLGIVTVDSEAIYTSLYIAYTAVPRVDIEIDHNVGVSSRLDLKPHNWKQANGIIEVSSEDRHVARIELKRADKNNTPLSYGYQSLLLEAKALDSRGNPVDEVTVTFSSQSDSQEIKFEGNLLNVSGDTNSDGSLHTTIAAPLVNESSSLFFSGEYPQDGFPLDSAVVGASNDNLLNEALIFEVLKVDPFQGSNGLTLSVEWDYAEGAFAIDNNFESEDYKLFRNALKNSHTTSLTGTGCFSVFYNSGFIEYSNFDSLKKVAIKNITATHIYVHLGSVIQLFELREQNYVKLFRKNENTEGNGLERLLYRLDSDGTYKPIKPDRYNSTSGKLFYNQYLQNENRPTEGIVAGYRIYFPKKESIVASCYDPATGLLIQSDPLEIKLNLSDIYKSVLLDSEVETRLGVASHLSYDPVGNNIYFEAD